MAATNTTDEEGFERTICCTAVPQVVQAGGLDQMYRSCPHCGQQNPETKEVPLSRAQEVWEERHSEEDAEPDGIVARAKNAVGRLM
jgi:hypothetical protein